VLLVWGAGLVEHPDDAPVPPPIVIGGGLLLLAAFVLIERRSPHPLIKWTELRNAPFMRANGTAFTNTFTTSASGTLIALVAQRQLGLDAWSTGLILLPFSIMVVIGSTTGRFWLTKPATAGMAAGLAVVSASMVALAVATASSSVPGLAIAIGVAGLGLSWAALTSTSTAMQSVPGERQGTASGAINTAAQIGTALGVATLLTVSSVAGGDDERFGFTIAFVAAAILAALYALTLLLTTKRTR